MVESGHAEPIIKTVAGDKIHEAERAAVSGVKMRLQNQ